MTFRARILRPEASQGRVGLGLQATVVPVGYSRARAFWEYGATDDAWQKFEYTWVDTFARGTAVSFASSELWQGKAGEVGCYIDQILVMLQGQPGDRIVCYLDVVELSGEVPAIFVYEETVAERWSGVTARTQEQLAVWQFRLDDVAAVLAQDAAQVPAELVSQIQERYDAARELLAQIQVRGWILTEEPERVGLALAELERMTTLMVTLAENKGIGERGSAGIIYVVPPISTIKILPTDRPEHGKIAKDLQVVATPGEFEPASFVVFAVDEITGCWPTPGDLVGEMGTIPASAVEIKIVQRWFQAGTAWWGRDQDKTKRVLVPELLVNDPTLVKVDYENQENYLKLSFASHEEYVRISNPADVGGRQQLSINAWPVKDSPVLLPVDIPRNQSTVLDHHQGARGCQSGGIHRAHLPVRQWRDAGGTNPYPAGIALHPVASLLHPQYLLSGCPGPTGPGDDLFRKEVLGPIPGRTAEHAGSWRDQSHRVSAFK